MSDDPQLTALWQALSQDPNDWDRYRILADFYEENGDDQTAEGLRWLADNEKRPFRGSQRMSWYDLPTASGIDPASDLDTRITKHLTGDHKDNRDRNYKDAYFYKEMATAILDCVNALARAGIIKKAGIP